MTRRWQKSACLLCGSILAAALASVSAGQDDPLETDIQEASKARLVVNRIRIEPTRWADLGECRNLTVDDLAVAVRGKKVDSDAFDLDREWRPTLHAIALDTSGSMAGDMPYAQYAAGEYVRQLRQGYDKAFVVAFDENVTLLQGVTEDKKRLLDAIDGVRVGARTAMLDAMYYAMRELDAHRERPVLVLLTDGADIASFFGAEDVAQLAQNRPDLTVFTVGVGLRMDEAEKPTKQLLRELAESTNGQFFDVAEGASLGKVFGTIHDILENEAILTVTDPRPDKGPGTINVRSRNSKCKVRMFKPRKGEAVGDPTRIPIPRPFPEPPQSYSSHLTLGHRKLYQRAAAKEIDRRCSSGGYFHRLYGGAPLEPLWFFHVGQRAISGCGLDVTMEHGLLYDPLAEGLASPHNSVRLRARPFELELPPLEELPRRPEEVMDELARIALGITDEDLETDPRKQPPESHARPYYDYPNLAHGMCFMEMRPVLARAAFLYPQYQQWTLAKLKRAAEAEVAIIEEGYRRRFPDHPDELLRTVVRQSEDGKAILARAETPSEVDLQKYLAAWLGDIPAHELFRRWEILTVDRLLTGEGDGPSADEFADAWRELRRLFFVPSYARTLAMLAPVYDEGCDCVGFWRVMLPRTSWMKPRMRDVAGYEAFTTSHLDLVPDEPMGLWVTEQVRERRPDLVAYLGEQGFRVENVSYRLIGEQTSLDPVTAFAASRVTVTFVAPAADGGDARTFRMTADLALDHEASAGAEGLRVQGLDLTNLALTTTNDPNLESLVAVARTP